MNGHGTKPALSDLEAVVGPVLEGAIFLPDMRVYCWRGRREGEKFTVFDTAIIDFHSFWSEQEAAAQFASPTGLGH
jgi:hypothetical protein